MHCQQIALPRVRASLFAYLVAIDGSSAGTHHRYLSNVDVLLCSVLAVFGAPLVGVLAQATEH